MIVLTVGRSQGNDIVIDDPKVSRSHLQLAQDEHGGIFVVDLGSSNGTFVNGVRINKETQLFTGDKLRIGNTTIDWQKYFTSKKTQPTPSQNPQSNAPVKSNGQRSKIWIPIATMAFLLLIAGGTIFIKGNVNESNQQITEEINYSDLEKKVLSADRDAAKAAAEYEEAQKLAAISKSEKDIRKADSLKRIYMMEKDAAQKAKEDAEKKAEEANRQKDDALIAQRNAEKEKDEAVNAKNKAEENVNNLQKQKERAEKAKEKALEEAEKAKKDAEEIKEMAKLTEKFYTELNKARQEERMNNAAISLGIKARDGSDSQYNAIIAKFNKASDNDERKELIKTIKTAKKEKTRGKRNSQEKDGVEMPDNNTKSDSTSNK